MSSELLCRHCGFVFWVEETLARHCQQFHMEEENKLLAEENKLLLEAEKKLLEENGVNNKHVTTRKRKRGAGKKPKGKKITAQISAVTVEEKFREEKKNDPELEENEKNPHTTTETIKVKKASIVQHIINSSSTSLPSHILELLPKTTKISVVAGIEDRIVIENPVRKVQIVQENPVRKFVKARQATQKCEMCSAEFTNKARLDEHISANHIYKCGHCKTTFQSMEQLKIHQQQPHYLTCGLCRYRFVSADDLTEHQLAVHFACVECVKTFISEAGVEQHMKNSHQLCEVCEDFFNWAEPGHKCFYTRSNTRPSSSQRMTLLRSPM
eukprot:GFUD01032969.1.p1 GENE.GFUD01032969.1~~GFUD01032969.1.p1  ORF type:complete len:326 (-),score=81.77 GFUD01032969.1:6-983(-)